MCSKRYKTKGVKGCERKHFDEEVLKKAFVEICNALMDNKQHFLEKWAAELEGADELQRYSLKKFRRIVDQEGKQEQFDETLCLKMVEQIEVMEGKRQLIITLLDRSKMICEI